MVDPELKDVGRFVVYTDHDGERRQGVITSFSAYYVFVRYGEEVLSKPTRREDLDWVL